MTSFDPCKPLWTGLSDSVKPINQGINDLIKLVRSATDQLNQTFPKIANIYNQIIDQLEAGAHDSTEAIGTIMKDLKILLTLLVQASAGSISALISLSIFPLLRLFWSQVSIRIAIYVGMIVYVLLILGTLRSIWVMFRDLFS